jgi:hypothetical protein
LRDGSERNATGNILRGGKGNTLYSSLIHPI